MGQPVTTDTGAVDSAESGVIRWTIRLEKIVQVLQEKAGATYEEFRGEVHIFIHAEQIIDVLTFLRDEHAFSLLSVLTAVDYWPQENPRFHVIYQLTSLTQNMSLQLRVPVNANQPKVPTATRLYSKSQIGASVKSRICSASSSKVIPIRAVF